jgi:hypothetical protein
MNNIAELYTLELEVSGSSTSLGPRDADISISDSIYSIYPKVKISIRDESGIMLDSRFATLGVPFNFVLGYNGEELSLPFIVNTFQTPEQRYQQYLNGTIEIELIHSFFNKFSPEYKAYPNVPSEIITSILRNEKFQKKYIESTSRIQKNPYYNPGYSFQKFIEKILLPNSRSIENSFDPFYCFIDTNNNFHYETYGAILKRKSLNVKTLYYRSGIKNMNELQKIMEFRPFSLRLDSTIEKIYYNYFYLNEDGSLEKEKLSLLDNKESPIPIFKAIKEFETIFNNRFSTDAMIEQSNIEINLKKKKNSFFDRIAVTTLLDISSCAGKLIDLEVDIEQETISASYSGRYLIEASTHIWDSKTMKGYTQMILSRQKTEFPVNSRITGDLIR